MKKKLTNNIGLKILSILFAFLLWLVVVSVDDPVTTKPFSSIPVELINTQAVTGQGSVYEVLDNSDMASLHVTAQRSVLDSVSRDNFKATADMTRMDGNLVPIEGKATKYADRIENISLRSKNVTVRIEGLLEKQLNIKVRTSGELSEGCVIGSMHTDKNVVKISGPESIVSLIDSAAVTVDVSGMTSDISTAETIVLYDAENHEIAKDELTLSRDSVNVTVEIWKTKVLPVSFGYSGVPAAGYGTTGLVTSSLSTITVAGKQSVLDGISGITVPSSAVDITNAHTTVETQVDVSKYLPDGLVMASADEDAVAVITVMIQELSSKNVEVPTANIMVMNVPEGMEASIGGVGELIAVGVRGLGEEYDNINPADIKGIVDLSTVEKPEDSDSLTEGVYDAKVTFTYPAGISAGEEEVTVKVILKVKGEE